MRVKNSPLLEIAPVLVRLDHVASRIVNVNHSIVLAAALKTDSSGNGTVTGSQTSTLCIHSLRHQA